MTEIQRRKCDGCEREVEAGACDGWFSVKEVVATQKHLEEVTEEFHTGKSTLLYGDFCSLACVADWAASAEALRDIKRAGARGEPPQAGYR